MVWSMYDIGRKISYAASRLSYLRDQSCLIGLAQIGAAYMDNVRRAHERLITSRELISPTISL